MDEHSTVKGNNQDKDVDKAVDKVVGDFIKEHDLPDGQITKHTASFTIDLFSIGLTLFILLGLLTLYLLS